MNSQFTTSHKSKQENPEDETDPQKFYLDIKDPELEKAEKENKNKSKFIKLLKEYIEDRKG